MRGNKEDGGNRDRTSLLPLLPPVQIYATLGYSIGVLADPLLIAESLSAGNGRAPLLTATLYWR